MTKKSTTPKRMKRTRISSSIVYSKKLLAVILGGGRGTRLFPLTKFRSKPAVPIAGKYRLIDVPISNCINSRIDRIFILTQFNSESLNRHIAGTYRFDIFRKGFISILAAEQTPFSNDWYQGTADAVRQNIPHLANTDAHDYIILSGDHLYRMDYRRMYAEHLARNADITVAVYPVKRKDCSRFGIMKIRDDNKIVEFAEKPNDKETINRMQLESDFIAADKTTISKGSWIGSMGIYIFKRELLHTVLKEWKDATDFGSEILPRAIDKYNVYAHIFNGYWEDIGTISSWYNANLKLTAETPSFQFYDERFPIYTHPRFLPSSTVHTASVKDAVIGDGCIIMSGTQIINSVIGLRSIIRKNVKISDSIVMGADWYEEKMQTKKRRGRIPLMGIGEDAHIVNAIIDKNARIGKMVRIKNHSGEPDKDEKSYSIRDGIVIIPKNTIIPDNTII